MVGPEVSMRVLLAGTGMAPRGEASEASAFLPPGPGLWRRHLGSHPSPSSLQMFSVVLMGTVSDKSLGVILDKKA